MSVFVTEAGRFAPGFVNLFYLFFCIALIVSGVICIFVFGKKYGFRLSEDSSGLGGGQKFKAFFIGITMLPALLYFFYSMSRYILNFQQ
jgi:heme/copper-type cytochrome/quinol oxidase subunit 2